MTSPWYSKSRSGEITDRLIKAYRRDGYASMLPRFPEAVRYSTPACFATGLGDAVVLTSMWRGVNFIQRMLPIYCASAHWENICARCPNAQPWKYRVWLADCQVLCVMYDCVNGHETQRLARLWNLPVPEVPKGYLSSTATKVPGRVVMHLNSQTSNTEHHRKTIHPRAREVYPETLRIIERFVAAHREMEFLLVGSHQPEVAGAVPMQTDDDQLIDLVASAEYFLGIDSGPMHVAAAFDVKGIVIVNFPKVHEIILPVLRQTGTTNESWYYPQYVHLHQDGGTEIVPQFSFDSLSAAFNGEVYPFWSHEWLPLVLELTEDAV